MDKLLVRARLENQVGGRRRPTEEADRANMILWRPYRDSILSVSFPGTSVPGSGFYRPFGTGPVASIRCLVLASVRLVNLDGQSELANKLILTSETFSRPCGTQSHCTMYPGLASWAKFS